MKSIPQKMALSLVCFCYYATPTRPVHAAASPQADLQGAFQQIELGKLPAGWKVIKGDWGIRLDQQFAPEGSVEAKQPLPFIPAMEKESLLPRVSQKMLPRV